MLRRRHLPALVLACALAAHFPAWAADIDWSKAKVIEISMGDDYKFTPDNLRLKRGQPYRLHFVNRGKDLHEFDAGQFLATATLGNPEVVEKDSTEVDINPAGEKDLLLVPNQAGKFDFQCDDHEVFGMRGTVTVE